jgi:hypothetical protein
MLPAQKRSSEFRAKVAILQLDITGQTVSTMLKGTIYLNRFHYTCHMILPQNKLIGIIMKERPKRFTSMKKKEKKKKSEISHIDLAMC